MIPPEKAPTASDSLLRILRNRLPWLFYTGVHTYRVHSAEQETSAQTGGKLALEPSGTRLFKAEKIVLQWSGAGMVAVPKVGSEVGIVFLDHDPTRPAIVAWQALSLAGGRPDVIELDADTAVRLGRHAAVTTVGDPAGAELVASAPRVDNNFDAVNSTLAALATHLALPAYSSYVLAPISFQATAVGNLKSS